MIRDGFPKLSSYVRGVDLLYHEATFGDENEALAKKTGHSTARHAATVARDAGVRRSYPGSFLSPLQNSRRYSRRRPARFSRCRRLPPKAPLMISADDYDDAADCLSLNRTN
ncbi:MAG: hypothetical protein MZV63_01180 [Marinilabiliales bacterium]|nr:hypothetical protein [Marinilabiliales bacterium]